MEFVGVEKDGASLRELTILYPEGSYCNPVLQYSPNASSPNESLPATMRLKAASHFFALGVRRTRRVRNVFRFHFWVTLEVERDHTLDRSPRPISQDDGVFQSLLAPIVYRAYVKARREAGPSLSWNPDKLPRQDGKKTNWQTLERKPFISLQCSRAWHASRISP